MYLLPGFILKSVIVAGGYGTGREIVEFFTRYGAWGGILGMITAVLFFAVVIATTYEFARVFHAYDYRSFFKKLLGPGAVVYEIVYIIFFILVLSIVGSAAGEIISDFLGLPYVFGMAGMILLVGALNFLGREIVAKSLTYWSLLLYFIFIIYFIIAVEQLGGEISRTLDAGEVFPGWIRGGLEYSWYNLGIVPAVLFAARSIETRKEAVISGAVTPFLVLLPAFFFHLTFLGAYPEIIDKELPAYWMLGELAAAPFLLVYVFILFGTFVETGAGLIQGVIERVDSALWESRGKTLNKLQRGTLAVAAIIKAMLLGTVGIVTLIAEGYSALAWAFFFIYPLPVLTWGIYKIMRKQHRI